MLHSEGLQSCFFTSEDVVERLGRNVAMACELYRISSPRFAPELISEHEPEASDCYIHVGRAISPMRDNCQLSRARDIRLLPEG